MDNLSQIGQLVDQYIDPNGTAGSILAQNHNTILKEVLNKLGKYTGIPYLAHKSITEFTPGKMSWNGNALNVQTVFDITFSKLSADLNDLGRILKFMVNGDIIKFKDFVGRAVLLEFQSYAESTDTNGNDIYNVQVKGFPENLSYIYQSTETQIAVFDLWMRAKATDQAVLTIPQVLNEEQQAQALENIGLPETLTIDNEEFKKKKGYGNAGAGTENGDLAQNGYIVVVNDILKTDLICIDETKDLTTMAAGGWERVGNTYKVGEI